MYFSRKLQANSIAGAVLGLLLFVARLAAAQSAVTATPLGPVYGSGAGGFQSYLRVFDSGNTSGTVTVTLLSQFPVPNVVGTWTGAVAAHAARQIAVAEIEAAVRLTAAIGSTLYDVRVTADFPGYVQHLIWVPSSGDLVVSNGCGTRGTSAPRFATNVHTNRIAGYPSAITVQNSASQNQSAVFDVYDAANGSRIGTYAGTVPANGAWTFTEARFAADTGFTATANQYHLNFVLPGSFPGWVTHTVANASNGTGIANNLSETCALSDGLTSPTLPAIPYRYADAALLLPNYFTDPVARGSAAATDNTPIVTNPITDAGAALGRVLFYDRRLSANNTISCASCHQQALGFGDSNQFSRGFAGGLTDRHAMALSNARFYQRGRFFWDERAATLEDQVLGPIQNSIEMGMTLSALVTKLAATDFYPALFNAAFGTPDVTSDRISKALAQFVRSLVTYRSKYDAALAAAPGQPIPAQALSPQEHLGLQLFGGPGSGGPGRTLGCARCHETAAQVLDAPQNDGLDATNVGDQGVARGRFKVPSLRNVAVRGRYMHDGRFSSLAEVIEFYNSGVKAGANLSPRLQDGQGNPIRLNLTQAEKDALAAFLNTLTDQSFLGDVRFANPFPQ